MLACGELVFGKYQVDMRACYVERRYLENFLLSYVSGVEDCGCAVNWLS